MPLDPTTHNKEILTIIIATGLKIFANQPWAITQYFDEAERFVKEIEDRFGKLNP